MVGRNIQNHCNVGLEVVHVVELERAKFNHVHIVVFARHLQGQTLAHVSGQAHIEACVAEYVVCEQSGGGFTVGAGNTHHLGIGVTSGEFNFGNHRDAFAQYRLHYRRRIGDSGRLHHLIGCEDAVHAVSALFPGNAFGVEHILVFGRYLAKVAQPYVLAFVIGQNGGSGAAFAASQHHYAAAGLIIRVIHRYRILRVTNVMAARIMPIIQKRSVIFDSGIGAIGR